MTTIRDASGIARQAAVAARTEELFRACGALREGHFLLKSGRHGDRYLEKFLVLQHPAIVSELCGFIASRVRGVAGPPAVDVVAGPTTGGVILAFEVARQLGVRGIFAEEVGGAGEARREFRRGFALGAGEHVLLVDDVLTTGGSLVAMLAPTERAGAELVLASVLVDRSGGSRRLESPTTGRRYPLEALWSLDLPTFAAGPDSCPGCARGMEVETPGASGASGAHAA